MLNRPLLLILVLIQLILVGCSAKAIQVDRGVEFHPQLPRPVVPAEVNWIILDFNGSNYIGLEFNQFLDHTVTFGDLIRYIEQSNNVICYYRKDLDERRCEETAVE